MSGRSIVSLPLMNGLFPTKTRAVSCRRDGFSDAVLNRLDGKWRSRILGAANDKPSMLIQQDRFAFPILQHKASIR